MILKFRIELVGGKKEINEEIKKLDSYFDVKDYHIKHKNTTYGHNVCVIEMEAVKIARVERLVTDMGTGCALCSECDCNLDGGDPLKEIPDKCPKCGSKLIGKLDYPVFGNVGGSDY